MQVCTDGVEIAQIIKPAGKYCAFYDEIVALLEDMKWIEKSEKDFQHQITILIATDSKFLTETMKHPDWKNSEYWTYETRKVISRISPRASTYFGFPLTVTPLVMRKPMTSPSWDRRCRKKVSQSSETS